MEQLLRFFNGIINAAITYGALFMGLVGCDEEVAEIENATPAACEHCPQMVAIDAGAFLLGSPEDESGHVDDEGPQREINVAAFSISRYEITAAQFRAFTDATGYTDDAGCFVMTPSGTWGFDPSASWRNPGFDQDEDHPVVCVTWEAANAYIQWLNTQVADVNFRLLSEAEWAYAARAGTTSAYWWGSEEDDFCEYTNGVDQTARATYPGWERSGNCNDGFLYTAPVGHYKRPNAFGVEDMVGNVWEWVADCYVDNFAEHPTDATAIESADCEKRVFRGGAWGDYGSFYLRTAYRGAWNGTQAFAMAGFRVAAN